MKTIFALASGRSGTSYLAHFFKHNVSDCYSTHEPYFTFGNPVLFGKAVAWNTYQEDEKLLPLLQRKKDFIARVNKPAYFESNHAFLKTCHRYATRLVDQPGFIHLVRDPRYVAKSELVREQLIRKIHLPFSYYKSGDKSFFQWSLTGDETIFDFYKDIKISRYQFYVLQWIEIEYRAMQLLAENNWQGKVFFIEVEKDFKDKSVMLSMLDFFNLAYVNKALKMDLRINKTPFIGKHNLAITTCKNLSKSWQNCHNNTNHYLCGHLIKIAGGSVQCRDAKPLCKLIHREYREVTLPSVLFPKLSQ